LNDANGIAAFTRDAGKHLVVLNFRGGSWEHYDVGVRGRYQELANTSWPVFNLGNYPERTRGGDRAYDIVDVAIPPTVRSSSYAGIEQFQIPGQDDVLHPTRRGIRNRAQ
jgi:hypothetical protein